MPIVAFAISVWQAETPPLMAGVDAGLRAALLEIQFPQDVLLDISTLQASAR
jgi:hypothetical protein